MDGALAVLTPLGLALLGGLGYLGRRYIEGSREAEKVKAIRDWVEIHKAMYGTAPSIEDVDRLRDDFLSRSEQIKKERLSTGNASNIDDLSRPEPAPAWMFFGYELSDWEREQGAQGKGIWTQLSLNERAHAAFKIIDGHLASEVARWNRLLNVDQCMYFQISQDEWLKFREAQATFAASEYKGGTVAPMVYWGEMFDKTQQRLSGLEKSRGYRERQ